MVEAPTPKPPIKRKAAKEIGSLTRADPKAEIRYNTPMMNKVFFLPSLFVGIPPKMAPTTVPHSAIRSEERRVGKECRPRRSPRPKRTATDEKRDAAATR